MGKAYLREMRIAIPEIKPDQKLGLSEDKILGAAMVSYFGGRSEIRARKLPVPVIYCDFLSMYPTVNVLMGMWNLLTAKKVRVQDATADVRKFVSEADQESLFRQETWKRIACSHFGSARRGHSSGEEPEYGHRSRDRATPSG